jgi:hypothetical protein
LPEVLAKAAAQMRLDHGKLILLSRCATTPSALLQNCPNAKVRLAKAGRGGQPFASPHWLDRERLREATGPIVCHGF